LYRIAITFTGSNCGSVDAGSWWRSALYYGPYGGLDESLHATAVHGLQQPNGAPSGVLETEKHRFAKCASLECGNGTTSINEGHIVEHAVYKRIPIYLDSVVCECGSSKGRHLQQLLDPRARFKRIRVIVDEEPILNDKILTMLEF
jgi:hypothetical protein